MKTLYRLICLSVCLLFTCSVAPYSMGQSPSGNSTLIKDICPGGCGSTPTNLTAISLPGGSATLYFRATNGSSGPELFKSNGTSSGTVLIKDIRAGKSGSFPTKFTAAGSKVFFVADDGVHGQELWKTDGTTNGTALVKDIWPGTASAFPEYFDPVMVDVNGILYFVANDGSHGMELWKSDGTTAGTVLLRDFKIGITDGGIKSMANFQNKLVFSRIFYAPDVYGPESCQLWRFDPTTQKFSVMFGMKGSFIDDITTHLGNLYFGVGDASEYISIYKLNADQTGGTWFSGIPGYYLGFMRSMGGKLVVAGADEYNPYSVAELDVAAGYYVNGFGDGVQDIVVAGNIVYYAARDYYNPANYEDGYSIFKAVPGVESWNYPALATFKGRISDVEVLGNQVIFSAYTSANGSELRFINASNAREGILSKEVVALKMYPNPASSHSTIEFSAQETGLVDVELYDMQGNKVQSFFEGEMNAGESRQQEIDATAFASGMYFVKMTNGKQMQYQKLTIAK